MTDNLHEITIIARDAKGGESIVHGEVRTQSSEPAGAANEILESYQKEHGKDRVRYVDPSH